MTNKDLFISYGRRESLGFVGRLHQQLKLAGYDGWFDKVDIPDGEKYDKRINHGIEAAHNFVYVMAPRCMTSPYCLLELEYARILGKRVIPIDQMQLFKTESANLSDGDKQILVKFYQDNNIELNKDIQTTQDVLDRSNFLIDTTDWLAAKEEVSDEDCQYLLDWAKKYENHWAKHNDLDYLKSSELPVFGENIDTLESVVERITAVLDRQTDYVHHHTEILVEALLWQKNKKITKYLLVGEVRLATEKWLSTEFKAPEQPPCQPIPLICEFICESRKNAENHLTDIFICGDTSDICNSVVQSLSRYGKTCWLRERDMQQDVRPEYAIEQGIEGADNFLLFSNNSCQHEITHALNYNKRIILVGQNTEIPDQFKDLPCFNFNQEHDIHELLKLLAHEQDYYHQHKLLLVRSRKWAAENRKSTFLLQGHRLELAKVWLDTHEKRSQNSPLPLHHELITASDNATHQIGTELFVSYSRKDNDFVQKLNTRLQEAGKTVWFDQESQQSSTDEEVDFEQEAFKGIDNADNFIFVVSPPSVASPYCQAELEHATKHGKRVILLLYRQVELELPDALRLDCTGDFETVFLELIQSLEQQKYYVHQQTEILAQAQYWQQNQKLTQHLLVGQERTAAEDWLLTEFLPPAQAPCQPTPLICEFICEARKNAENLMTDIFICYDVEHDKEIRDEVIQSLSYHAKTCWTHDRDIKKGEKYARAIERGIEGADNFFFFISPSSVVSDYCLRELAHALKYHKRIVPLLIKSTPVSDMPDGLRSLQYIDLSNNLVNEILNILKQEQDYYKQHKVLLVRALKWKEENQKSSFLLRGHNLDNAKTWLRLNDKRKEYFPLNLHKDLITASEAAKGQLGTDIFISYSRKDGDFARQLNTALQEAGKTTWFDQESISTGVDFEKEIYKGIDGSDNFVFVISPDAVESEYCEREVNYANEQNKRFISVLHQETYPETMPEALRKINWIDFKDTEFDKSFPELIQAVELDRKHAHQHTVLQQRAGDWIDNDRSKEVLLNMLACDNAEKWRDTAKVKTKMPLVTLVQDDFIQESREAIRAAHRMRNIAMVVVTISFVVSIFFGITAWFQKQEAEKSEIKALSVSSDALFQSDRTFDALLTGLDAAIKFQNMGIDEPELEQQVYSTLQNALYWVSEYNTLEHKGYVYDVNFSSNDRIASITSDGTLYLWQKNGQLICTKSTKNKQKWSGRLVSFSFDGKMIVIAGANKKVTFWGNDCKQIPIEKNEGLEIAGDSVTFSPTGQQLVTNSVSIAKTDDNQMVKLWKPDGSLIKKLPHKGPVYEVSFSPNESWLALAGKNTVTLWDWKNNKTIQQKENKENGIIYSINIGDLDKQLLTIAANSDQTVSLWRPDNILPWKTWKGMGTNVRFKPQDKTIFASANSSHNKIKLWRIDGTLLKTLTGHDNGVNKINFSLNGQILASASYDNTVKLWKQNGLIQKLHGHNQGVHDVRFISNDQWLVTISFDNTIKLWKKDGTLLATYPHTHDTKNTNVINNLNNLRFFDEKTLLFNVDSAVKILRLNNEGQFSVINEASTDIESIFHLRQGQISISKSKQLIATASKDNVKLWQWKNNKLLILDNLKEGYKKISIKASMLVFSPDGNILAAASEKDHRIVLWHSEEQKYLITLIKHNKTINDLHFSPDNQILASASDDTTVNLWHQENGHWQFFTSLKGHTAPVRSIDFSIDGQTMASVDKKGGICFWKKTANDNWQKMNCEKKAHHTNISKVRFSAKAGNIWASASHDKTIKLWHKDGTLLTTLFGHTAGVVAIDFSSDGKMLASSSGDKTIILWNLELIKTKELTKLISHGCQWIKDYLVSHQHVDYPLSKETCQRSKY
ncbi:TIR domain-containing protein [Candidatus Halobeggiatoa sp. HSG11]|nr:TIR domain-containing protein [Candidatus Halobeggiatoa sp. HSG11]